MKKKKKHLLNISRQWNSLAKNLKLHNAEKSDKCRNEKQITEVYACEHEAMIERICSRKWSLCVGRIV